MKLSEEKKSPVKLRQFALGETKALAAFFLFMYCGAIFLIIADWSHGAGAARFDDNLISMLGKYQRWDRSVGPEWIVPFMKEITSLGSITVISIILLTGSVILWYKKQFHMLATFSFTIISGAILTFAVKYLYFTDPTSGLYTAILVKTHGFPSGHASMAAVVYLTAAVLFSRTQRRKNVRTFIVTGAVVLIILISVSRVFVGAHLPTEVFAGLSLGLSWASLCWLLDWYFGSRIFPYTLKLSRTREEISNI